jgi:predicted phage baseplate assembly protein
MATGCTCANLTCCGCCEGITQETPQTIYNRPGLSAIAYRTGTYTTFYQTLLARIAQSRQPSLRQLRSREPDDFTIALLDAFSVMSDVVTFYSERIANEAYLDTATETRSVAWLANLVGYRMSPGVAADAILAFTIDPSAGAYGAVINTPPNPMLAQAFTPAQPAPSGPQSALDALPSTVIPVGTQVQSIPGPGQMPQTFETVQQISARPEWNAIAPRLVQPQKIDGTASSILLTGSITTVKNGDWLLLVPPGKAPLAPVNVHAVAVSSDGKTTEVDLAQSSASPTWPVYSPVSFADGVASPQGSETTLQAARDLPSAAALLGDSSNWWDAGDILAAATANQWPLDQLSTLVNQLAANSANALGSVYAFRQQAAPFGYNAPNYYSLPPSLRFENIFATSSPPNKDIAAAYPASEAWDSNPTSGTGEFTLDAWGTDPSSGDLYLYLDSVYSQIVRGSYMVLISASGKQETFKVEANVTTSHQQFTISAKVSRLSLTAVGSASLGDFSLRSTTILCQAEALPLAQVPITNTNIGGTSSTGIITLAGAFLGLAAGQQIVVSGTSLSQNTGNAPGPPAVEVHTLTEVQVGGGFTVITLDTALSNLYLRSSVSINANVAPATHGQTVSETLGSGDGARTFQSFVLHQSPLTYVQAETVTGSTSTLKVYVDGVQWTEVPYFYGHGTAEHIFITAQDDNGVTTITFGDGITGSRLPTGTANVTATYRFGIGTAGLVNAGQLSQLMSRPLGVRSVNNPLPSTGAADPQDLDNGRDNATLAITTLGRVVSLEDYQDFALAFPGIGKALATWTWDGQQRVVVLTVAGADGPIAQSDSILTTLQGSIANCSEPDVAMYLLAYTPIYFNLNAVVQIKQSYQMALVQPAMEAALRQTFSFEARSFGQPVYQSEVIAAIQDVPGVVDVVLSIYFSSDPSQTPETQLAATVPQAGSRGQIVPAQLLTLDPGPLELTVTQVTQ